MDDEELAKYPGLQQRNGIWYIRKRVPSDLVNVDKRGSVRISLDTAERKIAISRYALKLAEITAGFDRVRKEVRDAGNLSAALRLGRVEMLGRAEIEHLVKEWWARRLVVAEADRNYDDDQNDAGAEREELDLWVRRAEANGDDHFATVADHLLTEAGFAAKPHRVGTIKTQTLYPVIDKTQRSYQHIRELVARALRIEDTMVRDRAGGARTAPFDPLFNPTGPKRADAPSVASLGTVGEMIAEYRAEREALRGKESTARKYGILFRVLEEVLGWDLPAHEIDRAKCVEIYAFLTRLPPNATKIFPDSSLAEAVELGEKQALQGLAASTVSSYMQNLSAILAWAENGGRGVKNNSKGLVRSRRAQVQRRGYTPDELRKFFDALSVFRETDPTKFWVPALAVFTGARAGEICQLRVGEVVKVGSVDCIDLSLYDKDTGELITGNRLKNRTSERIVPLHSSLIDAGFLKFATGNSTDRLFPDLVAMSKGNYTHNFSKWFGRFKKMVGFNQRSLVFHSFRHGFRDACREAGISEETALALGGWARSNQGQKYGDRSKVPILHKAVEQLDFGGFRLPLLPSDNHRQ